MQTLTGTKLKLSPELPQTSLLKLNETARAFNDDSNMIYRHTIKDYLTSQWIESKNPLQYKKGDYGHRFQKLGKWAFQDRRTEYDKLGIEIGKLIRTIKAEYDKPSDRDHNLILNCQADLTRIISRHIFATDGDINIKSIEFPPSEVFRLVNEKSKNEGWNRVHFGEHGIFDHVVSNSNAYEELTDRLTTLYKLTWFHYSLEYPSQIAYYPTLNDMVRGRELVTKCSKFLAKYKDFLGIDDKVVKYVGDMFLANTSKFNDYKLEFIEGKTTTDKKDRQQDRWIEAYSDDSNIRSCMSNKHYVQVYCHERSQLRLACLYNDDGNIVARSIVRDEPDEYKGYIRVYPSPSEHTVGVYMKKLLSAHGYSRHTNFNHTLLDAIPHHSYDEDFVAPYLDTYSIEGLDDNTAYETGSYVEYDEGEFLKVDGSGEYCFKNTNGCTNGNYDNDDDEEEWHYCNQCDYSSRYEDDLWCTESGDLLCGSCADNLAGDINHVYYGYDEALTKKHGRVIAKRHHSTYFCYTHPEYTDSDVFKTQDTNEYFYARNDVDLTFMGVSLLSEHFHDLDYYDGHYRVGDSCSAYWSKYGWVDFEKDWHNDINKSDWAIVDIGTNDDCYLKVGKLWIQGKDNSVMAEVFFERRIYVCHKDDVRTLPNGLTFINDNLDFLYLA